MKLFILLGLAARVLAQTQTQALGITATSTPTATAPITPPSERPLATCSADPLWRRLRNAQGSDPCALAMDLQQMCTTIDPIVALTGGESYTGPQNVQAATPCICTTVMYNLVAGCAAWSLVIGSIGRHGAHFAQIQPPSKMACVSSTAAPSSTSTPTSTPAPTPENQTSNNVPIIVGAVLGAIGFILLLTTIFFCYLRRRQRKWEENEGVNRPDSTFIIGKPTPAGQTLQKAPASRYGLAGLFSPTEDQFEKPRPIKTESALPDVLSDEHRQGKPEYVMPAPTPGYANPGSGFGGLPEPQSHYTPVPNPGVAGVGAGGRGLQTGSGESVSNLNTNRFTMRDGPQGAAAQMLAADIAAARAREGAFREDFSAEGQGYQTSTDADGQSQLYRNGNSRTYPSYPHGLRNGNDNGRMLTRVPYADHPEEEVHAVSTVDDTSISIYPSSVDRPGDHPAPFVGGFSPVPEKPKEEYQLPDRGYSAQGGAAQPSPPLDSDPFGANRRPTAFSRVFGERPANMAGIGTARGSPGNSPTSPTITQGRAPIVSRIAAATTSPIPNRPTVSPTIRRGPSFGNTAADMGFGRQHQAAVGALGGPIQRDSGGFSEGSSPTAVGFPGDVGSARGEGSPLPTGPFAGRSGFGVER
ncbi:hypothetical protein RhiTH_006204 [Rhizoctonia solani]